MRQLVAALVVSLLIALPAAAAIEHQRGDLVRFGASVHIPEEMLVDGSVVVIGGTARVDGRVMQDVVAIGGGSWINGPVGGDVVAIGGRAVLEAKARVDGDVTGIGWGVEIHPDALVRGKTVDMGFPNFHWGRGRFTFYPRWGFLWHGMNVVAITALAVLLGALFPQALDNVAAAVGQQPGRSLLMGLLLALAFVPGMIFLILTIVGIPLIIVLFAVLVAAWMLGYSGVALFIGRRITGEGRLGMIVEVLVGVVLLSLVRFLPVFGWLLGLVAALFGLGAVLDTRFGTRPIN
ncbi:MAG: hypothetical protein ACOYCE_04845 [Limnochordia bacterium]|jgi:hypothetical protein